MAIIKKIVVGLLTLAVSACALVLTAVLLLSLLLTPGSAEGGVQTPASNAAIMDRYDMYMTNRISSALEGVLDIEKVYWLRDEDQIAPEPDQSKFGSAQPSELGWLLEDAAEILDGQETLFNTDLQLFRGGDAMYYLDETIFAVTWKQVLDETVYTISEVKIAHPSQFRRFLAGGSYASGIQMMTTQMAESVNAVVASSGDFYAFRRFGVIVYEGKVQRADTELVDTCYIDDKGDLHFSYRGELNSIESAQKFVDENNIRFSLAFGPVLVNDGQPTQYKGYALGEVGQQYARAALCQLGPLHYLLVTVNSEGIYKAPERLRVVQNRLVSFGVDKAYCLDGGQTAAIVMNDKLINRVVYGYQRDISDIIYFATAIPDGD